MRQQYQFQTLLQDNQLDKNVKKTLTVIFCTYDTNKNSNANEDIINVINYLDKKNLIQNENFTDQEDLNIELLKPNSKKFLEDLLANVYKK